MPLIIRKTLDNRAGDDTPVDVEIPIGAMVLNGGVSVTATVRVIKSAACATELVVTPVAIDTVHCT